MPKSWSAKDERKYEHIKERMKKDELVSAIRKKR
jgi:hypothetical protein